MIESRTCLLPMITEETILFFRVFRLMRKGVMPFKGSYFEQPNIITSAFELLESKLGAENV